MLKLELASEVAEKVEDIHLYCTANFDFCAPKEARTPSPCQEESLIHLRKASSYTHTFSTLYNFDLIWNAFVASITVKLVMLKLTLNTINEVKVPSKNELSNLLSFEIEERNKFTDVKISITNSSESPASLFHAHKAILAAKSPVFAKMFELDFQESATSIVTISDISPEVFKELITYIYTGRAPHIQTLASSLLNAAEKYQLDHLKALCERQMSYGLQVENAAETLVLAHTYRADQLKKNALMFIIKHRNEVRETKDWEKVHDSRELLEELLDTALELATNSKSIPELLQKFPKN